MKSSSRRYGSEAFGDAVVLNGGECRDAVHPPRFIHIPMCFPLSTYTWIPNTLNHLEKTPLFLVKVKHAQHSSSIVVMPPVNTKIQNCYRVIYIYSATQSPRRLPCRAPHPHRHMLTAVARPTTSSTFVRNRCQPAIIAQSVITIPLGLSGPAARLQFKGTGSPATNSTASQPPARSDSLQESSLVPCAPRLRAHQLPALPQ